MPEIILNRNVPRSIVTYRVYRFEATQRSVFTTKAMMEKTYSLEFIIHCAPHVLMCVLDNRHHMIRCLALTEPESEAVLQSLDRSLTFERRETRVQHELHHADKLFCMRANSEEGFHSEVLEKLIPLRVPSAHKYNHLMVELERMCLEFDALHKVSR